MAAVLLVVVFNIDTGESLRTDRTPTNDAQGPIVEPGAFDPKTLTGRNDGVRREDPIDIGDVPSGGMIQATDDAGRLSQQVRFASFEPNPKELPARWVRMTQPDAEFYLSNDRVVVLTGETAEAFRPAKALESGSIRGNVVVRLFDPIDGKPIDIASDEPALTVNTQRADFDSQLNEIRCDGEIRLWTRNSGLEFVGEELRLQLNDMEETVNLTVERVESIRLVSGPGRRSGSKEPQSEPLANEAIAPRTQRMPTNDEPKRERSPAEAKKPAEKPFYRLTLLDDVRIVQGDPLTGRVITGDRLELVFSMDSEGLSDSIALRMPGLPGAWKPGELRLTGGGPLMGMPLVMVSIALGQSDDADAGDGTASQIVVGDEPILITCAGRLTMHPTTEPSEQLASREDSRLTLVGRPVVFEDLAGAQRAECATLVYEAQADRIELAGTPLHELVLTSPKLAARAERFWLSQVTGEGQFVGRGSMEPKGEGEKDAGFKISWADGVELRFAERRESAKRDAADREQIGRLRSAVFNGEVNVTGEAFEMTARQMKVGFDDETNDGDAGESIRRIEATGMVRARRLDKPGSIGCDALELDLQPGRDGKPVPELLVATGNVEAADVDLTLLADSLRAMFKAEEDGAAASSEADRFAEGDIETLIADGDVQVLLASGARVFADRLVGDSAKRTVDLTGENVQLAFENILVDRGTHIVLSEVTQTATWAGSGEFQQYAAAIIAAAGLAEDGSRAERIARPAPTAEPEVRVKWIESMTYDSQAGNGDGSVTFLGAVHARATPTVKELNELQSARLTLEFVTDKENSPSSGEAADAAGDDAPSGEGEPKRAPAFGSSDRRIARMIADGTARLESREWLTEDHTDAPRVFYVTGERIDYDNVAMNAVIPGAGTLLLRDERTQIEGEAAAGNNADANQGQGPFGAKGTTLFRWKQRMDMTRQAEQMFDVVMAGDVEVLHRSVDGAASTLSTDRLEASVSRLEDNENGAAAADGQEFGLGGPAELRRMRATGPTFVRTPRYDVECDAFDYDQRTGIADISAGPGRSVMILPQGSSNSLRVSRAKWEMNKPGGDVITVDRGVGGARQ